MKTLISIVLLALGATFLVPRITTITSIDKLNRGLEYTYEEPRDVALGKHKIDSLKIEVGNALKEVDLIIKK